MTLSLPTVGFIFVAFIFVALSMKRLNKAKVWLFVGIKVPLVFVLYVFLVASWCGKSIMFVGLDWTVKKAVRIMFL